MNSIFPAKRRVSSSRFTVLRLHPKWVAMQDRLLNAYLTGTVDQESYGNKANEIKSDLKGIEEAIEKANGQETVDSDLGVRLFDLSQNLGDLWLVSNTTQKREILNLVCLNRTLSDVSLVLQKTKPFDLLAERLSVQSSCGGRI
jgi:hypothetical protein